MPAGSSPVLIGLLDKIKEKTVGLGSEGLEEYMWQFFECYGFNAFYSICPKLFAKFLLVHM